MGIAVYARTAIEDISSINEQIAACFQEAAQQKWEVVAVFVDNGASGKAPDRSGFSAMLSRLEKGDFQVLLAKDIDRFSRDMVSLVNLFAAAARVGASIETTSWAGGCQ